ncbi:hypothetical protein ACWKSP_13795 [Micromonosporaceae bacterium Da 78-11]
MTMSVYLLADTSGSTVRDGVNEGWHLALPQLVAVAERYGPDSRICVLTYADEATLQVPLISAHDLGMIPWMPPGGLSSLAAGLRLLARVIGADLRQLSFDGLTSGRVLTLVVAHGLPTDPVDEVLEAREPLDGTPHGTALHVIAPPGEDTLALAGLRATVHPMDVGDPGRVAGSIVRAAQVAWAGSGGPQ